MALVPIRVDRTSKPPIGTPLRSDGHWSVQGLVASWAFNDGAGKTSFEGVTSERIPFGGNIEPNWECDTVKFVGSGASRIFTPASAILGGVLGNCSIIASVRPGTLPTNACLISVGNSAYNRLSFWTIGDKFALSYYTTNNKSTLALTIGVASTISGVRDGVSDTYYKNGLLAGSFPAKPYGVIPPTGSVGIGVYNQDYTNSSFSYTGNIGFILVYSLSFNADQIASLSANPWQIYEPETVWVEVGGGAEAALFAGTISGSSSVSANLSTSVVLAAAAQGSATAQAALSTALELAAQVNGIGSAAGTLGADISGLAGSLSGSSEAQATLSTAIHLMGLAAGQCAVIGRLAEPVEILAQLRVMAADPLALTISVRDPLALRVTVH